MSAIIIVLLIIWIYIFRGLFSNYFGKCCNISLVLYLYYGKDNTVTSYIFLFICSCSIFRYIKTSACDNVMEWSDISFNDMHHWYSDEHLVYARFDCSVLMLTPICPSKLVSVVCFEMKVIYPLLSSFIFFIFKYINIHFKCHRQLYV